MRAPPAFCSGRVRGGTRWDSSVGGRVGGVQEEVALVLEPRRRAIVAVRPLARTLALSTEPSRTLEDEAGREEAVVVEVEEKLALHRVDLARRPRRPADKGRIEVRDFGHHLHGRHVGREDNAEDSVLDLYERKGETGSEGVRGERKAVTEERRTTGR